MEEVKEQFNVEIENDDVYMATTYDEFVTAVVLRGRGLGGKKEFTYDAVSLSVRVGNLRIPVDP